MAQKRTPVRIYLVAAIITPLLASGIIAHGADSWVNLPQYRGGITSAVVAPSDSDLFYIGTEAAGVFVSDDAGLSWQPSRQGLPSLPILSLAVDPGNANVVYAGTDGDGVWKTTSGGSSWLKTSTGLDDSLSVEVLAIDPQVPQTVFAGLGDYVGNIYRSDNGGSIWNLSDDGIPRSSGANTSGIKALVVDPVNTWRVYAGTASAGAFSSVNSGDWWDADNSGIPFDGTNYDGVGALAFNPHDGYRPCTVIEGFDGGYFCRNDLGDWTLISNPYDIYHASHLYFHPSNPLVLLAAGSSYGSGGECKRSNDGGVSWFATLGYPDSGDVSDIAFHPSAPDVIVAAGDVSSSDEEGGVFRSTNGGLTWLLSTEGVAGGRISTIALDPSNLGKIFAGTHAGGVQYSLDSGATWQASYEATTPSSHHFGFEVSGIVVDPSNDQRLYMASNDLWTSADGGVSFWTIPEVTDWTQCIALAMDPSPSVYVGTSFGGGVYKGSATAGFAPANNGFPTCYGSDPCTVSEIAIDPNDETTVWAGTEGGGGAARTTDGGASWISRGLDGESAITAIAVKPGNSQTVLAASNTIYKTTNGGGTWQTKLVLADTVTELVYLPGSSETLYAATDGSGIYRSINGGETWQSFDAGVFCPEVDGLAISNEENPHLVAGTNGCGVYRRRILSPDAIMIDGFESGNTTAWSSTAP